MKRTVEFIKKEAVLLLSALLAAASAFFVPPSAGYLEYIDFRTLSLLFCLMAIMAGLNRLGVFKILAEKLLCGVNTVFGLTLTLVLLCFFSSMIITNDVALITFVPFSIVALKMAGRRDKLIYIVTLETVAANLGSMLTPIGNPQNLYLFSAYKMEPTDFFMTIAPYAALSLALLVASSALAGRDKIAVGASLESKSAELGSINRGLLILYAVLFCAALLSVFRVLNFLVLLAVVAAAVLIFDKKTLLRVDYSLLLTFVFLFIFIGNLGAVPWISELLRGVVDGGEVLVGVAASQIISNVPAAVLLSGFTDNASALLIGVNLGGLGTFIASMASLISFKYVQKERVSMPRYLLVFTVVNVVFLALNLCLWLFMS